MKVTCYIIATALCCGLWHHLEAKSKQYETISATTSFDKRAATVLVYIAGRNDLDPFWERSLWQMAQIGSNENLTIVVHLNTAQRGKKITQRLLIFKNKIVQVGESEALDSGDPATLTAACAWAFTHFPSDMTVLMLWNHGSGPLNPENPRATSLTNLYSINPVTKMIELNRSIGFFEYLATATPESDVRGICFDWLTRKYLTNKQVGDALRSVVQQHLHGKPLSVVCCDACFMQCIEFCFDLKAPGQPPVANYLVGSQEVVLAAGYPYTTILARLAQAKTEAKSFAEHVVTSFVKAYRPSIQDYTQSVIDLTTLDEIYQALNQLARLLIEGMQQEVSRSVRTLIRQASSREHCTHFHEPTYKDLSHFLQNMLLKIGAIQLAHSPATQHYQEQLSTQLKRCIAALEKSVVVSASGTSLPKARGLSIYLPHYTLHPSYRNSDFAHATAWLGLLTTLHGT